MNYVVVDLEWNQAISSSSPVFNRLPIHLRGEIIEIGAVKLNRDMTPGEEFTIDIKPVYFRKMHYKVQKITGFDGERLSNGLLFPEAMDIFRAWCGDDVTFITWGCDDQGIMEQNIIIHDLDWDWIHEWINLQTIFNLQTGGGREQKSLKSAMEHFEIEQTRVAHDALGDAYNTALICSRLDMREGLRLYPDAARILAERSNPDKVLSVQEDEPEALDVAFLESIDSKAIAFTSDFTCSVKCPVCGNIISGSRWINQGDQRYINLYHCETDGDFFTRLKFKKHSNETKWDVRRIMYEADANLTDTYKNKLKQARRRGRRYTNHRGRPA